MLINREAVDGRLDDVADIRLVDCDEAVEVHKGKEAHDELAIHTVRDTAMARDRLAEILDLERPLESGGEEPAERSDERCEAGKNQDVELHRLDVDRFIQAGPLGEIVRLSDKGGIRRALQSRQNIRAEVVNRAGEVLVAHQDVGHEVAEDDGEDPRSDKSFDCLLRRNLDQLGPAKRDAADIGEDIVRDHKRCGQEEPNHAFEHIVHDEVRLDYDQIESHMSPGKLGELEPIVPLLQRANEEDETSKLLAITQNQLTATHP